MTVLVPGAEGRLCRHHRETPSAGIGIHHGHGRVSGGEGADRFGDKLLVVGGLQE